MACRGTSQGARIGYLLLLMFGVIFSLVLRFQLAPLMVDWEGVELAKCEDATCAGNEAVYRVAGSMCAFFLVLASICACSGSFAASAHRGYWAIKVFMLTSIITASLWIPNGVFDAFASVSRVFSVLFVLYQGLLLIDFAYMWNSKWVSLDEESDSFGWRAGILAVCIALYVCCFTAIGFMYSLYTDEGCGFSRAVVTICLIAILLFTGLGVSPLAPHGALLPSAIIAADCVYLAYSALASNPVAECNPFAASGDSNGHETLHLVVGITMAGVSIAWKANSAASSGHLLSTETQGNTLLPLSAPGATAQVEPAADSSEEKEDDTPLEDDAHFFHLTMAISCMYFGTLPTDWGTAAPDHDDISQYDVGWASAWVKVGTQWSIIVMYIWTLVAPAIFPERDFGG
eukprot:CAMPEP_0206043066 /NCGR_PEP_ID=MMETSP1466-20131121/7564_1 /ASSEMBLY_ACC=CAM_ASM_001126 /TAXON_ID=44452 /ORGANISM="Pavlova gyrans, Strain CCMP608" /LENGTH=401 /DNA_ID=CAMNT_0053417823 /DNA_START=102 /DNA_END=1307 /DNA_ORIENTATION=-